MSACCPTCAASQRRMMIARLPDVGEGFALRLAEAFKVRGMTVTEFAILTKMQLPNVRRLRRAPKKTGPTLATVQICAAALGVSPAWLAFGEGGMDAAT